MLFEKTENAYQRNWKPRFSLLHLAYLFIFLGVIKQVSAVEPVSQGEFGFHRGVYEIELAAKESLRNPYFDVSLRVIFTRPDNFTVTVDGFFDGNQTFKARAYCDDPGVWSYQTRSN